MLSTIIIFFVATFLRSILGFGDALIAMPLLTLTLGIKTATPLFALVANSTSLVLLLSTWRHIDFKAARQLFLATLFGIPVGLLLLETLPEPVVTKGLGYLLLGLAGNRLLGLKLPTLESAWWTYLFGFVAGILGSAYNTNGPPVITYGVLRRWPPESFRASLQGYFFPSGLVILASHGMSGLWTVEVGKLYLVALPFTLVSTCTGIFAQKSISEDKFEWLLIAMLIALGILLAI